MLVDGFDQKEERLKMLSEGGFKNNSSEPSYFPTVCVCLRGTIVSIAFSSGLLQSSTREWDVWIREARVIRIRVWDDLHSA